MESWQFIQSPAGDWYWLCSNVISRQTRTSTATFKTRMECVANAMGSGYQKIAGGHPAAAQQHHRQPVAARSAPGAGNGGNGNAHAGGGPKSPGQGQGPGKRNQRRNRNRSGKRSNPN